MRHMRQCDHDRRHLQVSPDRPDIQASIDMAKLCHTHVPQSHADSMTDEPSDTSTKGEYMTDISATIGQGLVPNDHTLMVITMTVGVPNYFCDDHSEQAHDMALDQIIECVTSTGEITVLGYDARPLTLIVGA